MAFVHGHARDSGWVVAHVRAPVDAQEGQLSLVPEPDEPEPETSPAGEDEGPASAAGNSAITHS